MSDPLTPAEALQLLRPMESGRAEREATLIRAGYPAYTTSAGWLGYSDDKIRRLCREALAQGWNAFKMKIGSDPESDIRRCRIMREEIGGDRDFMVDANQARSEE